MTEKPLPSSAVVLACDADYLPFSLFVVWQILHHNRHRRFDVMVVSEAALTLPDWARVAGVENLVIADTGWIDALPSQRLARATYLRLALPDALPDRYRRVLYLDSDMFFEGGNLDRLLALPMGEHAVGAVTDIDQLYDPAHHATEFKALGLPALRYFNAGVLLIDTAAYRREAIFQRCLDVAVQHPRACHLHDQSLLNAVLQGRFAELAPVWNWQSSQHLPFATMRYPVRFRHFVGRMKPWKDPSGRLDQRYRAAYADFFQSHMPDAMSAMGAAPKPALVDLDLLVRRLIFHTRRRKVIGPALARFADEWQVKL